MTALLIENTAILMNIALLFLLTVVAFGIVLVRRLMASAILLGIFSLLIAAQYLILDAPDVAITEAAVGAGLSTALLLASLVFCGTKAKRQMLKQVLLPLAVILITGTALVYAVVDMPVFGDSNAPAQQHVAPYYLETSGESIGIPNVVTSVLASYRGFDTLGEAAVVFTAAVGVLLLLGEPKTKGGRKNKEDKKP